ncbi:hypothetical protein KIL84_012159 [Mauremys mutica]|uniref:Carboxymethylenebutenolidase homolog n=1 Tax=Mauremys mutica TaxID=74926 RepID=A0A9D3XF10_9SAUR|nr:hypothetical protein KIL84_012159 [Mauremys mutica]
MTSDAQPFLYDIGKRTDYVGLGHEEQVEHIKAYVCKPSSVTDKAVIVIHDIYGWQFPDIRYIADLVAAEGYVQNSGYWISVLACQEAHGEIILLEKKLKQYCQVEYRIKVYPGQVHGFAELKPDDMKPRDKPYIEEARKDMMNWLKTYV